MKKNSTTIVGITGHSSYTNGTMYAIWQSYLQLQDKIPHLECLLISPDKPEKLPKFIRHCQTKPFSYLEYNLFTLYALDQFIDTEYALIVQEDGWVVNGNAWDNCFFNYDYVGAIIPIFIHESHSQLDANSVAWFQHLGVAPAGMFVPQNGGFCLRSKAMLGAPKKLGLPYDLAHIKPSATTPFSFAFEHGRHIEDIYLSGTHRKRLEQAGLTFAPMDIAMRFSVETLMLLKFYNDLYSEDKIDFIHHVLGRHSRGTIKIIGLNEILLNSPQPFSEEEFIGDIDVKKFFMMGYEITVPNHLLKGELKYLKPKE